MAHKIVAGNIRTELFPLYITVMTTKMRVSNTAYEISNKINPLDSSKKVKNNDLNRFLFNCQLLFEHSPLKLALMSHPVVQLFFYSFIHPYLLNGFLFPKNVYYLYIEKGAGAL